MVYHLSQCGLKGFSLAGPSPFLMGVCSKSLGSDNKKEEVSDW